MEAGSLLFLPPALAALELTAEQLPTPRYLLLTFFILLRFRLVELVLIVQTLVLLQLRQLIFLQVIQPQQVQHS